MHQTDIKEFHEKSQMYKHEINNCVKIFKHKFRKYVYKCPNRRDIQQKI